MLYKPTERKSLKSCPWYDLLLNKTSNLYIIVILRRICEAVVAVEKQEVLHILSVCVCSLVIQHAKRVPLTISSSVFFPTVLILPRCVTNGATFGEKFIEHKICNWGWVFVLKINLGFCSKDKICVPPSLKLLSETFFILSKNSARYHKYILVFT